MVDSIAQVEAELEAQVVAKVCGRDVTRAQLSAAFTTVANPSNWKLPIDARVPLGCDFDLLLVREAVIFFTGSVPTITPVLLVKPRGMAYRVQAAGYYAAVGA